VISEGVPPSDADVLDTPAIVRPHTPRISPEPNTASPRELFVRFAQCDQDTPIRRALRDDLVRRHMSLVHYLAGRFRDRGEALADLIQVGTIGLIKAVDRFDPNRGVEFGTFATPTIVGEIKRHFRDRAWAVRVPRRLQEQKLVVSRATVDLYQSLGRSPTITELAKHTGLSEEDVLEALETAQAYTTISLDAEVSGTTNATAVTLADVLGGVDAALEKVDDRESLRPLLSRLDERERQILLLRFFANKTQSEIAAEVGISQMHVSRLLTRTLAQLREGMLGAD
jgi:RNA polymerase sigma-B factor